MSRRDPKETCATCAFFGGKRCRRRAPLVVVMPGSEYRDAEAVSGWPLVSADEWCGEWEPHFAQEPEA